MTEIYDNPFGYFVFLSWSGFMFHLLAYVTVWKLTHWKQFVEKW